MKKKIIVSLLVVATLILVTVAIYVIVLLYNRSNIVPRDTTTKKIQGPIVPIVISKVLVTFTAGSKEAEICWDTSVKGISNVDYGLSTDKILTSSTILTAEYLAKHCVTLNNLDASKTYIYKLNSYSQQGVGDTYTGIFSVQKPDNSYSEQITECIHQKPVATNANKEIIVEFNTSYSGTCNVNFGIDAKKYDQVGKPVETEKALIHNFVFDTSTITDDLYYSIECSVDFPLGPKSCRANELVSFCKFGNCN
jgi:hypothetical protein